MDGQPTEGWVPQQPVPGGPQQPVSAPPQQAAYPPYVAPTVYGSPTSYGAPAPYGSVNPYGPPTAYGAPAGYGYAQPGYYGAMSGTQRNDLGVWALVLGILSLVSGLFILTGIPAIILGNMSKAAAGRGEANNPGLGTAGVVMGWISVAFIGLGVLFFVGIIVIGIAASTTSS